MKLVNEILNKRLELYNEFELTHDYIKAIWHFYSVYNMCLVITGIEDKHTNKKNMLIRNLIGNFNSYSYSKLQSYMQKDYAVINSALQILSELKEESDFYGDYDLPDMIAISEYD